ncbi:alpha/beta fold hydrolase [Streptomyces antimycoticus]
MNTDVNDTASVSVHGARHRSWQRAATQHAPLTGAGAASVAAGLPGHGFGAPLPSGYPLPGRAGPLTGRPQPADLTIGDCADAVRDTLCRVRRHGPLGLVAHRTGGAPASPATPYAPELTDTIACLSTSLPAGRPRLCDHLGAPANATVREQSLNPGHPQALDAVRTDPLRPDSAYAEELRQTQYHDTPADRFDRRRSALSPGLPPALPAAAPVTLPAAPWGRMRRALLRCAQNRALPAAVQDLMTAQTGRPVPDQPLTHRTLPGSHSPTAARPRELAGTLVR